jgi:hypothetical protein
MSSSDVVSFARRVFSRGRFLSELFRARDGLFGLRRLLHRLGQLGDLRVHLPDHLADAIDLDDCVLDRLLLALQRLRLVADVLRERVERGEPLLGALAQRVQLLQGNQLLLEILHGPHRGAGVLARFARGLADLRVVLRQRRRDTADLIELPLQRHRRGERRLCFGLRVAQLTAQLLQRRIFFAQRIEAGLRLQRLRGQLLHRFTMLAEVAVWTDGLQRRVFDPLEHLVQRLDPSVERIEQLRLGVDSRQTLGDFVETRRHARRLLVDLFDGLAERRELRPARRERRDHRAQRAALLARSRDQCLEVGGLRLDLFAATADVLERVQHLKSPQNETILIPRMPAGFDREIDSNKRAIQEIRLAVGLERSDDQIRERRRDGCRSSHQRDPGVRHRARRRRHPRPRGIRGGATPGELQNEALLAARHRPAVIRRENGFEQE